MAQTFVGIDYLLNRIALKIFTFSPFLFCLLTFLCCQTSSSIISGVSNSRLYPSFILNTITNPVDANMNRRISVYTQYNLKCLTLNKNHQAVQNHNSALVLLF